MDTRNTCLSKDVGMRAAFLGDAHGEVCEACRQSGQHGAAAPWLVAQEFEAQVQATKHGQPCKLWQVRMKVSRRIGHHECSEGCQPLRQHDSRWAVANLSPQSALSDVRKYISGVAGQGRNTWPDGR